MASGEVVDGDGAHLVVAVPATMARQQVPPSAFRVTRAGRPVPATVRRVVDAGLDVYLVLDTTVDRATLAAEQSAAADLLRNLPPGVRIATTTTDAGGLPAPSAVPGNLAALRVLAAVRPQETAFLPERLNAIASMPVGRHRRVTVLLTDCAKQAAGDLGALRAALATGNQQLDVIAPGAGCPSEVSRLAGDAGGVAVVGGTLERLDRALDTVLLDLLGQYRLSVAAAPGQGPLTVALDYSGVRAVTAVPAARGTVPPLRPEESSPALLAVLAAVAAITLAFTPAMAAHAFLRRHVPRPGRRYEKVSSRVWQGWRR